MAEQTHPDSSLNPHARGHQEDRVDVRTILLFAVGLVVVVAIVYLAVAAMMGQFYAIEQRTRESRPPLFAEEDAALYPGARLQETPGRDMARMRAEVDERLDAYGWVDREAKIAHIPIDQAIKIVAEKGISITIKTPAASPEADDQTTGGASE